MIDFIDLAEELVSLLISFQMFKEALRVISRFLQLFFLEISNLLLNQPESNKINDTNNSPNSGHKSWTTEVQLPDSSEFKILSKEMKSFLTALLMNLSKCPHHLLTRPKTFILQLVLKIDPKNFKARIKLSRVFQRRKMDYLALQVLDKPSDLKIREPKQIHINVENKNNSDSKMCQIIEPEIVSFAASDIFELELVKNLMLKLKRYQNKEFVSVIKSEFLKINGFLGISEIYVWKEKFKLAKDPTDVCEYVKGVLFVENYKLDFQKVFMRKVNEIYFQVKEDREEPVKHNESESKWNSKIYKKNIRCFHTSRKGRIRGLRSKSEPINC